SESAEARSARIAAADAAFAHAARELSQLVLRPIIGSLRVRRLLVVSDGEFQYLPLAALPVPGSAEPLIARYEIAGLPSAASAAVVRGQVAGRASAPRAVAVFADPVFAADDTRVSRPAEPMSGAVGQAAVEAGLPTLPRLHFS